MINPPTTIAAAQEMAAETPITARRIVRPARDFLAGLAVFAVFIFAVACAPGGTSDPSHQAFTASASAASISTPKLLRGWGEAGSATMIYRSTDRQEALLILGLAFAAILSFNLAFVRHLRIAYAPR